MGVWDRWYAGKKESSKWEEAVLKRRDDEKKRMERRTGEFLEEVFPGDIPDFGIYGAIMEDGISKRDIPKTANIKEGLSNREVAEAAGFDVNQRMSNEGYRIARKGNFILDVEGVDGIYRIWKYGRFGDRPISTMRNLDDAIDWVDNMVKGK